LKGVTILHDAHLHTAANNTESLYQLNFEVFKHPPDSNDLTPSELFGLLIDALRSRHFASDQEVKEVVHVTSHSAKNIFF
jgi:hypothetical protein